MARQGMRFERAMGMMVAVLMVAALVGIPAIAQAKNKDKDKNTAASASETSQLVSTKDVVSKGDTVTMTFVGKLEDGSVFAEATAAQPLEVVIGSGKLLPLVDQAIEGMKLNEEKRIPVTKEQGFGERNDQLMRKFPKTDFPKDFVPAQGMVLRLKTQDGKAVPGIIVDMTDTEVTVDLNHPLAGKNLVYEVKVIAIK